MKKRVLVIDDDDAIRRLIADVLLQHGYIVSQATDASEALHQAHAHRPDLIVLDLMLPGMTGWEFRTAQRQAPELANVPVIVISAVSSDKADVLGNVVARLSKPCDFKTFLWFVDRCVGSGQARLRFET